MDMHIDTCFSRRMCMVSGIRRLFNIHAVVDLYLVNNVRSIRNYRENILGSRKYRQVRGGVGGLEKYFSHQRISQRDVRTSLDGGPYQYFKGHI